MSCDASNKMIQINKAFGCFHLYDRPGDESRWNELVPVFSTWSMHIFTKLGTDVFSRWQRLVRLQPNTWSVITNTQRFPTVCYNIPRVADDPKCGDFLFCILSLYLWCSPCLGQPDRWVDGSETFWASSWFSSGPMSPYSQRSSWLRKTGRVWLYFLETLIQCF